MLTWHGEICSPDLAGAVSRMCIRLSVAAHSVYVLNPTWRAKWEEVCAAAWVTVGQPSAWHCSGFSAIIERQATRPHLTLTTSWRWCPLILPCRPHATNTSYTRAIWVNKATQEASHRFCLMFLPYYLPPMAYHDRSLLSSRLYKNVCSGRAFTLDGPHVQLALGCRCEAGKSLTTAPCNHRNRDRVTVRGQASTGTLCGRLRGIQYGEPSPGTKDTGEFALLVVLGGTAAENATMHDGTSNDAILRLLVIA